MTAGVLTSALPRVGVDEVVGERRGSGRRPPTTSRSGASAAARLAMLAACAGSHRTWRMAAAMAVGIVVVDDEPAPEASSSTACGNAVATTGRCAVTASMSTPEVTCSRESYGRSTTSADAASEPSASTSR